MSVNEIDKSIQMAVEAAMANGDLCVRPPAWMFPWFPSIPDDVVPPPPLNVERGGIKFQTPATLKGKTP